MPLFFLLRASEYTSEDSGGPDNGKGVRGMDIAGKANGEQVETLSRADEVVLHIRGSKTDQYNRGEWRNHFRREVGEGNEVLCVVGSLAAYERHCPQRFRGEHAHRPLFAWASGKALLRHQVQQVLENAAVAAGVPPGEIGSHSLRIGGASALWAAFRDSALVQRWGRWSSDDFHAYLWDSRLGARGVSEGMAKADLTPI